MVKIIKKSGIKISGINEYLSSWRKIHFSFHLILSKKYLTHLDCITFMKNLI